MKYLRFTLSALALFSLSVLPAQEGMMKSGKEAENEIASTTTEKTYKVLMGDKVIQNSVRINTTVSQPVKLADKDAGMVNQDRVFPKKKIVKTVKIDNDSDDAYDDYIRFSYKAYTPTDFVLIASDDELMVALDKGENLELLEQPRFLISEIQDGKQSFVFTDDNGKNVELYIEEYKSMNSDSAM